MQPSSILHGARVEAHNQGTPKEGETIKANIFGTIVTVYMHPQSFLPNYTVLTKEGKLLNLRDDQILKATLAAGDSKSPTTAA